MKINDKTKKIEVYKVAIHIVLFIAALLCVLPIMLIISSSFTSENEIFTTGYKFIPDDISLRAYQMVIGEPEQILDAYMITIFVTVAGTLLGLWLTTTLAYISSRRDYRFHKQISFYVFFTMLFNGGLVPMYILIASWLKLKDNYLVLVIPYLSVGYNVFLMRGFLRNTPESILESAKIDGAGEFRIFTGIVLPISKPSLATVGLFIAFSYWNDWFQSLMYIENPRRIMLQYLLVKTMQNIDFLNSDFARSNMMLAAQDVPSYSARMTLSVLAAGPMLFIFPFFQKYFIKGLTLGAVKG